MFSVFSNYFLAGEAVIPHFAIVFLMSSVETRDESKEIFSQFEIALMLYVFTPFSVFNRFSTILASQEHPMPSSLKVFFMKSKKKKSSGSLFRILFPR